MTISGQSGHSRKTSPGDRFNAPLLEARRLAFTKVDGADDWATSPVENIAKSDAAHSANNLRIFCLLSGHRVGPDIGTWQLAILERNAVNVFHGFCEVVEFLHGPPAARIFVVNHPWPIRNLSSRTIIPGGDEAHICSQ